MQAIVLARRDFRESDQLVTVYTKEAGKQEALARGLKKSTSKNAAALLPFFLLELEIIPGKDLGHLTKVQIVESFTAIPASLLAMKLVSISFDGINKIIRGQEHDARIFNGLVEWLRFLDQEPKIQSEILDVFFLKMWAHLGLKIELDRCVLCGKKEAVAIDVKNGGVLCNDCTAKKEVSDRSIVPATDKEINLLKLILVKKLSEANDLLHGTKLGKMHDIIYAFIQFHSHQPIADWAKLI